MQIEKKCMLGGAVGGIWCFGDDRIYGVVEWNERREGRNGLMMIGMGSLFILRGL